MDGYFAEKYDFISNEFYKSHMGKNTSVSEVDSHG